MRDLKKILSDVKVDHVTKQGIYYQLLRQGASEEAKKTFKREPYHMTASKREKQILNDFYQNRNEINNE